MNRTWAEATHPQRHTLVDALKSAGCDEETVEAVLRSGYYLKKDHSSDQNVSEIVYDSFISWHDLWPVERLGRFAQRINGKSVDVEPFSPERIRVRPERIRVHSVAEAYDAIKRFQHEHPLIGPMFYRGQQREYRMRREIPNPIVSNEDGTEPLIVPSLYRVRGGAAAPALFDNRPYDSPKSVFHHPKLAQKLIYRGLPNGKEYAMRNMRSISSLEFSSNPEFQEFHRRWRLHEVNAPFNMELPLVEQHYGVPTQGLDLTENLETALFFALFAFTQKPDGMATYIRGDSTDSAPGVVYCFDTYSLELTDSDIYREMQIFDHIPPVRPLRQACAYINCPPWAFNQVVVDVKAVLEVSPGFDLVDIPTAEELFPGRDQDPFYSALLELREDFPLQLSDVVRYQWA